MAYVQNVQIKMLWIFYKKTNQKNLIIYKFGGKIVTSTVYSKAYIFFFFRPHPRTQPA